MTIFPIELLFLALVPGNVAQATDQPNPAQINRPVTVASFQTIKTTSPRLPSTRLPLAIDAQSRVYDAVIPAIYEAPVSAEFETEIQPSSQTLTPADAVPVFVPSSQD